MGLVRRERGMWPDIFERRSADWPFGTLRRFEAVRRLAEEVRVEEFVEDGELVVRAEVPGLDPDKDLDVSIVDGKLCIRAERRHEERTEGRDYRRSEFRYGSFSRVLPLPPNADEQDIKASYKEGVLEVRTPLEEEVPKPSRIPISHT